MELVVAVTGASGSSLAARLLEVAGELGVHAHLIVTGAAKQVAKLEGVELSAPVEYRVDDLAAPVASGSFLVDGMVVVPCSMNTLAKLAAGVEDNLVLRSAAAVLRNKRPLVLVPREAPLTEIQLENLLRVKRAGADVLFPVLTFYHEPATVSDLVDFVVGRVFDLLGVPNDLFRRWEGRGSS